MRGKLHKDKITTAIVIPDMQVPYHDVKSTKAVESFMADYSWDYYINLGDFMDFDCISAYNANKLRIVEGKRIMGDYDIANDILDRHQSIIRKKNKKAEFVLLEGNHEERMERYIDANPTVEGLLEVENGLKLKERGFKWVRYRDNDNKFNLGKATFIHGQYTPKYHAYKHVENWGCNIFYGHLHDVQTFSMIKHGDNDTNVGQCMGCLCKYDQQYIKGSPTNWQQAFGVFYFKPNGHFTYYVPRIINNKFIWNGKEYSGSD